MAGSERLAGIAVIAGLATAPAAAEWQFQPVVEIAAPAAGVFHHIASSGRQNIASANGTVAIVWEDNRSGEPAVYLATSRDNRTFRDPVKVNMEGEAYEPVVQAFDGGFVVGWEQDGSVWLRTYKQERLDVPLRLNEQTGGATQINLTSGNAGELVAVWSQHSGKYARIHYAGLSAKDGILSKTRSAPLDTKPGAGDQNFPVVAYHEALTAYVVVWEDRRLQNVMLLSAIGTIKNGFSVGMQVNELVAPLSGTYGVATGVARAALASFDKHVAAVWSDKRNFRAGYDIYGAFAKNSGRFGDNQLVQDGFGEGFEQWHATIASNGRELAAAWDDDRDGTSDIWLSVYQDGRWHDDVAVPGAAGSGIQAYPSLAMDRDGGLHLVWLHRDNDNGPTSVRYVYGAPPAGKK